MHEFSIASGIIDTIAPKVINPSKLSKVRITASPLSGISHDSLVFCFNELCAQKGYFNAFLEINTVAISMKCVQCDKNYECSMLDTFCPACGSPDRIIISESPFSIDFIEIEE
jgi:hydrogenase nickel incorporation protein HypA/HybF